MAESSQKERERDEFSPALSDDQSYTTADSDNQLLNSQLDALVINDDDQHPPTPAPAQPTLPSLVFEPVPQPKTTIQLPTQSSPTRRSPAQTQPVLGEISQPPTESTPSSQLAPSPRRTAVILQDACLKHRYTRNSDIGTIVERPERIRAVKTGVAAAWARLESQAVARGGKRWEKLELPPKKEASLDALMMGLGLGDNTAGKGTEVLGGPFDILFSNAVLPVLDPALLFIHPLPHLPPGEELPTPTPVVPVPPPTTTTPTSTPRRNQPPTPSSSSTPTTKAPSLPPIPAPPPAWPIQLQALCKNASMAMLSSPFSEIPSHLPQGDLYLCPGSEEAIFGALGAVCEGIDRVVSGKEYDRAFVAIRPPGHHCCQAQPMGFCFVNNVAVAAAHGTFELPYLVVKRRD